MPEETLLLVGLGNPGEKYKNNRHNVGFMVLDYVTNQLKFCLLYTSPSPRD